MTPQTIRRRARTPAPASGRITPEGLQRVVAAQDFSVAADAALARALTLTLGARAQLIVLHVLPRSLARETGGVLRRGATRELARRVADTRSALDLAGRRDVTVEAAFAQGRTHEAICQWARKHRPDLVVLGRRGLTHPDRSGLGSTASKVLRSSPAPILLVARPPRGPYLKPLAAVDLSPTCRRALRTLLRLLPERARTRVTALHADETPFERALAVGGATAEEIRKYRRDHAAHTTAELAALLEEFAPDSAGWKLLRRPGDARTQVLAAARPGRADLVALGTQGRSGLARALLGSVAESVTREAKVDVLVASMRRAADE